MSEGVLRAAAVGVSGPHRPLLADVFLEARPGRVLAVTGASGSGKTTLLSVLGGLLRPDDGDATYDGQPVGNRSGEPRTGTAFVLQTYGLVPTLTAGENVAVALRARAVAPDEAVERSRLALERVGVGDLAERLVTELSGGQLQRVAVARALAVEPDVLLADEPTSELDEHNRDLVVAELRREADRGCVVVLATHAPEVADLCDDELHIVDGRPTGAAVRTVPTVEDGPEHVHDMFRRPGP
ncbi:ABC transporter ATP-binding protein [soil metagenome]